MASVRVTDVCRSRRDPVDIERITDRRVRAALSAVRYAKPLEDNPLLEMDALRLRLRDDGIDANPESLAWCLGTMLHELGRDRLAQLRVEEAKPLEFLQFRQGRKIGHLCAAEPKTFEVL